MFFSGTVHDAIQFAKNQKIPLAVFCSTPSDDFTSQFQERKQEFLDNVVCLHFVQGSNEFQQFHQKCKYFL